ALAGKVRHTAVDVTGEDWQNCVARGGGVDRSALQKGGMWGSARNHSASGLVLIRAWPALRRVIAPQAESTGYTENMLRPHAGQRAYRLPGRRGLACRQGPHRPPTRHEINRHSES